MTVFQFSVGSACNLNCSDCFRKYFKQGSQFQVPEFDLMKIYYVLRKCSVDFLIVLGGEPLIIDDNDFIDLFSMFVKCCKEVRIFSNGVEISDVKKDFIERHKDRISLYFTYRGVGELFDKCVGVRGAYQKWCENVEWAVSSKLRTGCMGYIPVRYEKEFFENIDDTLREFERLGIENLSMNETDAVNAKVRYADWMIQSQERIFSYGYKLKLGNLYNLYKRLIGENYRTFMDTNCLDVKCIMPDGRVINKCIREPDDKYFYGIFDECLNCPIRVLCNGGCLSIRANNNGKFVYCEDRIRIVKYVSENLSRFYKFYDLL